jgi:protein SCO1/2
MNKRNAIKSVAAGALLAGAAGFFLLALEKVEFQGIDITGAEYARDLPLTDHNGQLRSLADFAGKVVVVFFGYTQCPDVCPTSMSELAEVKRARRRWRSPAGHLRPWTPSATRRDAEGLHGQLRPQLLALRGSPEQLAAVAKDFKIYYKKVEGKTDTSYTMDHSAGSYVYDPAAAARVPPLRQRRAGLGRRRGHVAQRSEVLQAHWGRPTTSGLPWRTSRSVYSLYSALMPCCAMICPSAAVSALIRLANSDVPATCQPCWNSFARTSGVRAMSASTVASRTCKALGMVAGAAKAFQISSSKF